MADNTPRSPQPPVSARAIGFPSHSIAAAEVPGVRALLAVVVSIAIVAALYVGREVLIPITLAVLLSFILAPVTDLLRRLYLGRVLSVLLAALLALGAVAIVGALIATQLAGLAADAPRYVSTVERKLEVVQEATVGRLSAVLNDVGRRFGGADSAATRERRTSPPTTAEETPPIQVEVRQPDATPIEIARQVLTPAVHPLTTAGIVFVVAIFILLQRTDLRDRLIRLVGSTDLHRTTVALDEAARRLSRFFLAQFAMNTAYGTATWAVLSFIGVPGALLWGILAGLMRFVPYVGSIIAAAPPILMAAAVDPAWTMALSTALFFLVGEGTMGQIVEPVAFGKSSGITPVSVIVAAIFWSWIWGPIGLILSMPLTLCLVVLGRHVERLEFLDVLLGDQPALTPAESFYQRMLSGDADEALDQAELFLKDHLLITYYDDVLLKGLQFAARDAARGTLPSPQLAAVITSAHNVIADLASHTEAQPEPPSDAAAPVTHSMTEQSVPNASIPSVPESPPPAWRAPRSVLCIGGRGTLDEVAAEMLAQLLRRSGLGAETLPNTAVSREEVARLDGTGVAMVCVSYFEASGSPAHLRYLLRRLRQRLAPDTPILVGGWPAREAALSDPQVRTSIGADHYVGSLHEAVLACLDTMSRASQGSSSRGEHQPVDPTRSASR
ncbi:AI-2E family transporter [Roseomonas terrae]|uniref:AI-2E family transporter n=2 Tax=Neoroseomonas terrae TaxID=424799 RepID=A0ABS5ECQ2_9PROT|nr:AI-2E family transporter [Neoroseomonas terrae]